MSIPYMAAEAGILLLHHELRMTMAVKRKQKITPRALLELKMPGDVQIAPDGLRIAYSVSETDWEGNSVAQHLFLTTASESDARQLTRGISSELTPRWSPDGKWLAFLAARDDESDLEDDDFDENQEPKTQIWLLPMDGLGGEAEKLSDAPEGVEAYEWLPDASGFVYLAREPRRKPFQSAYDAQQEKKDDAIVERKEKFRQQIWHLDREDKKAKLVHLGDYGIGEIAISPDGKTVAFTTNYTGEPNDYHQADVWTVELETGLTHRLTDGPGGKFHPKWMPDSSAVLFCRSLDPLLSYSQENLYAVPRLGGEITHLTADLEYDLTGWHGIWFDSVGMLYVTAAIGTTTAIFRRKDGAFEPVVRNEEHIHDFHVAPNGGIAYVGSSAADVPELLWVNPGAEEAIALTDLNEEWAEKYLLAPTELVHWESRDGFAIEGLITYPIGYDAELTYPLLLNLHGGPHGRSLQALSPFTEAQVYASAGYAVLSPNYRGSEGYGNAFSTANRADLGGGDYADVMAGIDWAVGQQIADPDRLGVLGSSYGGYLTNWIIAHSRRFRAAISKFGIFSFITDFSNSQTPRWEQEYLNGYYWENPSLYTERSPLSFVKNIETPVLIMHGDSDPNTFIANSQEMYTALHLLGKTAQFVHYPREGHGFAEPQHRVDEIRRCLAWFDQYVLGAGQPLTSRIGDKIVSEGWELTVVSAEVARYIGSGKPGQRFIEVAFALRDLEERRASLTLRPADVALTRGLSSTGRSGRPFGLPLAVLGGKILAEGNGWKFVFTPAKEERGLAVPIALTFRITDAGGAYALAIKDFPPVTIDIPASDEPDKEKSTQRDGA